MAFNSGLYDLIDLSRLVWGLKSVRDPALNSSAVLMLGVKIPTFWAALQTRLSTTERTHLLWHSFAILQVITLIVDFLPDSDHRPSLTHAALIRAQGVRSKTLSQWVLSAFRKREQLLKKCHSTTDACVSPRILSQYGLPVYHTEAHCFCDKLAD